MWNWLLNDSIFQSSSPLRHSAEIRQMLALTGNFGKPIRVIYRDEGSDHRVTYPSVQLALVALFLIDDLDVLLAARCCPSHSNTNPAERWHSVMNLAFQFLSLERLSMDSQYERVMQRSDTMKAIRDAGEKVHGFFEALTESLSDVIEKSVNIIWKTVIERSPMLNRKAWHRNDHR